METCKSMFCIQSYFYKSLQENNVNLYFPKKNI